jgi:hypothetical protein
MTELRKLFWGLAPELEDSEQNRTEEQEGGLLFLPGAKVQLFLYLSKMVKGTASKSRIVV